MSASGDKREDTDRLACYVPRMTKETIIIFISIGLVYVGGITAVSPGFEHSFDDRMTGKVNLKHKLNGHNEGQYTKELYDKKRYRSKK